MRPIFGYLAANRLKRTTAYLSLKTGELQPLESSDTIADGLGTAGASDVCLLRRELAGVLLVTKRDHWDDAAAVGADEKLCGAIVVRCSGAAVEGGRAGELAVTQACDGEARGSA